MISGTFLSLSLSLSLSRTHTHLLHGSPNLLLDLMDSLSSFKVWVSVRNIMGRSYRPHLHLYYSCATGNLLMCRTLIGLWCIHSLFFSTL